MKAGQKERGTVVDASSRRREAAGLSLNFSHGGDREAFAAATGREPLDFSVNLNPLGIPEAVVSAYCEAASEVRYPDPCCRELTAALAEHYGLPAENILCGNGASDIIYRYFRAISPAQVLIPVPTFSEYPQAVAAGGGQCVFFPLREEEGFRLTEGILDVLSGKIDCLVLINPHNPTGRLIEESLFWEILKTARDRNIRVFVDACFMELTGTPFPYSEIIEEYPNVFILNAFTKTYAMAGMRLGFGMTADTDLVEKMRKAGPPWSVSWPAQKAGITALAEEAYLLEAVAMISAERERLMEALTSLGFAVIPSDANFIMFFSDRELVQPLAKEGIMIRDLNRETGLRKTGQTDSPEHETGGRTGAAGRNKYRYRIAVRNPEENGILLGALQKIVRE